MHTYKYLGVYPVRMLSILILVLTILIGSQPPILAAEASAGPLTEGFTHPPASARPCLIRNRFSGGTGTYPLGPA